MNIPLGVAWQQPLCLLWGRCSHSSFLCNCLGFVPPLYVAGEKNYSSKHIG